MNGTKLSGLIENINKREIFRFNLLILGLVVCLVGFPLVLPLMNLRLAGFAVMTFYAFILAAWAFVLVNAWRGLRILARGKNRAVGVVDAMRGYREEKVQHLVILCLYREPLELIEKTLDTLVNQTVARRLVVTLAFESKSPILDPKIARIEARYSGVFKGLLFTVHPAGVSGEIAGKCSNVNFSARESVRRFGLDSPELLALTLVTTCDADNLFHPRHFEELGRDFGRAPDRYECVWQAPLFYDWNSGAASFLSRNTGMFRSIFMLGALIPLQINTMSIQSLSLKLLIKGDYYHPFYQMEDILNVVRWMTETRRRVKIRLLRLPLLSGPTNGATFREEVKEWRLQSRRWAVGAAEVFHYYLSRSLRIPLGTSLSWAVAYFGYYYLFQMSAPLLLISTAVMRTLYPDSQNFMWMGVNLTAAATAVNVSQLLFLVGSHLLQVYWTRGLGVGEAVSPVKKFSDLLLSPVSLIAGSLVGVAALVEMAFRGKAACGHDPAAKEALAFRPRESEPAPIALSMASSGVMNRGQFFGK